MDTSRLTATALAALIRSREISALEATHATLARIETSNRSPRRYFRASTETGSRPDRTRGGGAVPSPIY